MITAAIDLVAAIDSQTLVTTAAGEHFWARVHLVPAGTGEFELLSGSTIIDHVQVGVAGGVRGRIFGDQFAVVVRRLRATEQPLRACQGFAPGPFRDAVAGLGHEEDAGEQENCRPVLYPKSQRIEFGVNRRRDGFGGAGHRARKVANARRQRKSAFKTSRLPAPRRGRGRAAG